MKESKYSEILLNKNNKCYLYIYIYIKMMLINIFLVNLTSGLLQCKLHVLD